MKTSIVYIHLWRFAPTVLALAAMVILGACGVTGPDETPWQNVAAYSWPTAEGTFMRYRVEVNSQIVNGTPKDSTSAMTIEQADDTFHGELMYRLNNTDRVFSQRVLFLPTRDTLFVGNGDAGREEFGGTYHLVAPLQRGHSWISGYKYDGDSIPKWKATILERLSHLQLAGIEGAPKQYRNVVVVKYELLDTAAPDYGSYWIRYYAEGQGPIQTIKNIVLRRDASGVIPTLPYEAQFITRTVLIESSAASN
jgi:hypothetical protein